MTREDFNRQGFGAGMKFLYQGEKYDVVSVNFTEALLGLSDGVCDYDNVSWVRCESGDLV